jgi:hypothetical protein
MKFYGKLVVGAMMILSLLSLMACGDKDKDAAEKIVKHLNEKYGEEFVVDAIGGGYGTLNNDTLKAEAYPKKALNQRFKAEITKDLTKIMDGYMNIIMAEKLDNALNPLAKPIFGNDLWIKTEYDSGAFPDAALNDRELSLKEYSYNSTIVYLFVKRDSQVDTERESKQIDKMLDEMLKMGIHDTIISVFYIYSEEFNKIESTFYSVGNIFDYFKDVENRRSYNNTWTEIVKSKKKHSVVEIKNNFYFK